MNVNPDDINALMRLAEIKLGRSLVTPYDFNVLTTAVEKKAKRSPSSNSP